MDSVRKLQSELMLNQAMYYSHREIEGDNPSLRQPRPHLRDNTKKARQLRAGPGFQYLDFQSCVGCDTDRADRYGLASATDTPSPQCTGDDWGFGNGSFVQRFSRWRIAISFGRCGGRSCRFRTGRSQQATHARSRFALLWQVEFPLVGTVRALVLVNLQASHKFGF